jgi:zinc/manganese transport system substrate-binding protein
MRRVLTAFFVVMAVFAAITSAQAAEKLKAVASFSILANFVARVGGDRVQVTSIVGPDGDAHVYEPRPDDAKAVAAADILVINGLGFEGWIGRLNEASGYKGRVVTASAGIVVRKMAGAGAALDPHAWQSVENAEIYIGNISAALCEADSSGCETYKANAAAYDKELQELDAGIRASVARIPPDRRIVITSHDAFGYFAQAYGVTFIAPEGVNTESEASARDMAKLIRQIRAQKATILFIENMADPRVIAQIARETGVKVGDALYSDALSPKDGPASTYLDMMRHNARLLTEAMAGS